MNVANFILSDKELQINNITNLKEFSDSLFCVEINGIPYEIKGSDLVLKEVTNENTSIKILGDIHSIEKKNHKGEKEKKGSFFKKLFS